MNGHIFHGRKSRREFLRLTGVATGATVLSACTTSTPQVIKETVVVKETVPVEKVVTKEVQKVVTATVPPAPAKPVELHIVGWDFQGNEWGQAILARFKERHPDVSIVTRTYPFDMLKSALVMELAQGRQLDGASAFFTKEFAARRLIEDITDKLKAWDRFKLYSTGQLERISFGGRYYAFTQTNDCPILLYNKDLLAKAGVQAAPTSWDELRSTCQAVKDANIKVGNRTVVPLVWPLYRWFVSPWVWQAGGEQITEDLKKVVVDSEQGITGYTFMQKLVKDGLAGIPEAKGATELNAALVSGWAAMAITGEWVIADNLKAGIKLGTAMLPKGIRAATTLGGTDMVIFRKSEYKDLVFELYQIFLEPEVQLLNAGTHAVMTTDDVWQKMFADKALQDKHPNTKYMNATYDSLKIARFDYLEFPFWWPEGSDVYQAALDAIVLEQADVAQTLHDLAKKMNDKLDAFYKTA